MGPKRQATVALGDWCAFRIKRRLYVGRILLFSYLSGKGKQRQFTAKVAPTTAPKEPKKQARGVGVTCDMYKVLDQGELEKVHLNEEVSIDKCYVATVSPPLFQEGEYILDLLTFSMLPF